MFYAILFAILTPMKIVASTPPSTISLPNLLELFMIPPGVSPDWSMGAGKHSPQIAWKSLGVESDTCDDDYQSCRRGTVRVSLNGKEMMNLRQRLEPVTWEILMASKTHERFGPQEISIFPVCDRVECNFDFQKVLKHSQITLKRLCEAGPFEFRQTAYLASEGSKQLFVVVSENTGSGGTNTSLELSFGGETPTKDLCGEARAAKARTDKYLKSLNKN
jgi:hypothetical protein